MSMEVRLVENDADLERASVVLLELRRDYDKDGLMARIRQQQNSGYRLAYVESGDEIICVAGFVICTKLAWGKHIYIDDLVTSERHRSSGAGGRLIDWFVSYARHYDCEQIHLDSGVQRFGAHRFYLREGFDITSHHFAITDLDNWHGSPNRQAG